MRECILNPVTNRYVFKDGNIGRQIVLKYGDNITTACVYNKEMNKCVKNKSVPVPVPVPVAKKQPTEISPVGKKQQRSDIVSRKLSDILKNVSSNNCDIIQILNLHGLRIKKVESLTKNSASETVIIKFTLNDGVELIAKVGYQKVNIFNDELFIENYIYKFLDKFNLPFVVEYVKQFSCSKILPFVKQFSPNIRDKLRLLNNDYDPARGFNILLTKMCNSNCQTVKDLIMDYPGSKEMNGVLLQCLYTLVYFEEIGLQHNDLHLGNIFVEFYPSNLTLKFNNKVTFNFSCNYRVRVYDFDFSSIVPTKYNFSTFYPNRRIDDHVGKTLCLSNKTNNGKRDTAQFLLNYMASPTTRLAEYFGIHCLPENLLGAQRPSRSDQGKIFVQSPDLDYFKDKDILPHPGHPCKVYGNSRYEIYKGIKSIKEFMRTMEEPAIRAISGVLNPLDGKLNTISPTLPSLAKSCKEYTTMKECTTPKPSNVSAGKRKAFRDALLKTVKSL